MSEAGAAIVFVGIADPLEAVPGEEALAAIARVEIVPLDMTDTESVADWPSRTARASISSSTPPNTSAPAASIDRHGLTVAREEMDIRYFGLLRLAQAFGPAMRARGADGANAAAAFVNLLSVHALVNWPAYGAFSAAEAACLSAAQCAARRTAAGRRQGA